MTETYKVRECINNAFEMTTLTRTWARYNPPIPSTDYSTYEYNMRRKAEILQYKNDKINYSGSTKKANFSRLVFSPWITGSAIYCEQKSA